MSDPCRVLIVDDDLAARLRLRDILQDIGIEHISEAEDGLGALKSVQAFVPDLVILDLMMPGMIGYEVCRALRAEERTREVPIYVVSAHDESNAMLRSLTAGADDFLRKPFVAAELRAKVQNIKRLNRQRSLREERDRFRWILDRMQEAVVVIDRAGNVRYTNAPARQTFGLELGTALAAALAGEYRVEPEDIWQNWPPQGDVRDGAFFVHHPETSQAAARCFKVEWYLAQAGEEQIVVKFSDCARAVRREMEMVAFQNLIAHKIRTPLCGLAPVLTLLEECAATQDPETKHLLQLAQTSAARLQDALLGVLSYHDALVGDRAATMQAVKPIRDIVRAAIAPLGLEPTLLVHGPEGRVAYSETVEFALNELFTNCAKFSGKHAPRLEVHIRPREDGRWALEVHSRDSKLPAHLVAELGRPYGQLERSFVGQVPGMGLGLATVRLMLRGLGGDLEFAPLSGEEGLCTTLVLPAGSLIESAA